MAFLFASKKPFKDEDYCTGIVGNYITYILVDGMVVTELFVLRWD